MTNAEIIKGTECCSSKKIVCADCPYYDSYNCVQNLGQDTIDLINRQKAEIERLKSGINVEVDSFASEYDIKIKAEAIKEFAKFLIDKADCGTILISDLPDLVKEKAGNMK